MSTRKQTALRHGNLCPNAPYHIVQHMSRDRPTNLDLKMCIIARQDPGWKSFKDSGAVVLRASSAVGQTLPWRAGPSSARRSDPARSGACFSCETHTA